jgi:hypothetical protein
MKLKLCDIIDRHKNQPALVMGLSSSLNPYVKKINEFDNYVKISCNHWFEVPGLKADYWVLSNSDDTINRFYGTMNILKIPVFYADSVDNTPREFIEKNLKCDWFGFDERHFNDEPYHRCLIKINNCCDNLIPGRLTIQEELKRVSGYPIMNRMVCTVAEHMITFALLMGCNPIKIIGTDIDYSFGYAKGITEKKGGGFKPHRQIIIDNLHILYKHGEMMGIEIINNNDYSEFFE